MKIRLALLLAALPLSAHAASLSDDLIANLYAMKSVYQANYAPAAWKKQFAGYDLENSFSTAVQASQKPNLTQQDSRKVLTNFISAMRDYHTSISFVSTESATLPFTVQTAEDRFFLAYIDRSKLSASSFPFQVGDELVTFDGQPALEAVKALQADFVENVAATDRARAALSLTSRSAASGRVVPQGAVSLGIRRKGSDQVAFIQIAWNYTPEKIKPRGDLNSLLPQGGNPLFGAMMNVSVAESPVAAENPFGIGARKTFTPDLGPKVWESEEGNTFYAYIYKTADRRLLGYLRLPSYTPGDYVKATADFRAIIQRFNQVTDGMVIDQVNNPGGSVFYLYTLASMLTDQPIQAPRHRMTLNQSKVSDAQESLAELLAIKDDAAAQAAMPLKDTNGYPASYEFTQLSIAQARFLISEWEAGKKLSAPYWIGGVDKINPDPTHYTKPVLVLINHLDFSGGDFFPTILQDNKIAKIMGARTAGAGGYVLNVEIPNNIGVSSFRFTGSIAERVDGNPIENLGVTPDVPYEITARDLQTNYADYTKAIQAELDALTR